MILTIPQLLIAASAFILLFLGCAHLLFTFSGTKFHPRKEAVKAAMETDSPGLTRQTTMWRAWVGFNASHSGGAILFGLVYGYLALCHDSVLFGSIFLIAVGLIFLVSYIFLAKAYWFSIPFRAITLAAVLFLAGLVAPQIM